MTIYTSYYANYRNFPEGSYLIQISRTAPPTGRYDKAWNFLPTQVLLDDYKRGAITEERYAEIYTNQLELLKENEVDIMVVLEKQMQGIDTILLCYEGKDKFCHRHLLAEWLNDKYGLDIKEL